MSYPNLQELLRNSSSSREYLLSLPVAIQLQLHEQDAHIHTQHALRRHADVLIRRQNHRFPPNSGIM